MPPLLDYQDRLLSLKSNVVYVAFNLNDSPAGKIGKLIQIPGKKQWTPNAVAVMLLYLLAREGGDDITFDQLKDLVKRKYTLDDSEAILRLNAFLTKIDAAQLLDIKPVVGHGGTSDPDPLKFFDKQEAWNQDPDITLSQNAPKCKVRYHYSTGYCAVTIWR
jgi:hypothetical protein